MYLKAREDHQSFDFPVSGVESKAKRTKNQQSDLKANGAQDEPFEIRSSRRYSAQMCYFRKRKRERELARLERKRVRLLLTLRRHGKKDNLEEFLSDV